MRAFCAWLSVGIAFQPFSSYAAENRSAGQTAAAVTAGVAAGVAALSCMKLYEQADAARAAGNSAEAERLSMMAAQQCAQAAQNAANAAQNQGGADQITTPNMETAQQSTPTTTTPEAVKEETITAPLTENTPTPTETQVVDDDAQVPPSSFENPNSELTNGQNVAVNEAKPLPGIKNDGITYDENASSAGSESFGSSGMGGFGMSSGSNSGKLGSTSLFDSVRGEREESVEIERRRSKKASSEIADSSEAGGSESSEGGSGFRSMLAGMMGGQAEAGGAHAPVGGAAAGLVANAGSNSKAPNIFEYANYRFRKLNREGELGATKVARGLASVQR